MTFDCSDIFDTEPITEKVLTKKGEHGNVS
ncbi:hypothetical protein FHR29_001537 [Sphingobacterium sp. JUb56]|nr:hypothetical protein [Sphingobacterium sp. JUb56]